MCDERVQFCDIAHIHPYISCTRFEFTCQSEQIIELFTHTYANHLKHISQNNTSVPCFSANPIFFFFASFFSLYFVCFPHSVGFVTLQRVEVNATQAHIIIDRNRCSNAKICLKKHSGTDGQQVLCISVVGLEGACKRNFLQNIFFHFFFFLFFSSHSFPHFIFILFILKQHFPLHGAKIHCNS